MDAKKRTVFCKTWSCIKEAAHPDFKMLLLFTEESLDRFNTCIFWWWVMFWSEREQVKGVILKQFIYQTNQLY